MTAQPTGPAHGPDTGSYEMIHLGGHAAVVVPLPGFMRLRALKAARLRAGTGGREDAAALQGWRRGRQRARPPAWPPMKYGSGWA